MAEQAQMTPLVPGIVVEELPVRLPNINNLRFRSDGQLTALGYNGKVYLLKDTDGDGLEDAAELYWDQPTLRVPVGMAWSDNGLYVSSQGKLSLLRDISGDGRADREDVVSDGWPAPDVRSGGVDATSVTLDEQGNVFFALICANYSNPYRLAGGIPAYDRSSLRGTILRLSADHTQREVIATGMRVPYTLAFNRHGDLFCTDQEGETWLSGGNPLDELNHIVEGRHYGFPPRHDEYLPDVVDEPPVVAFGPQHQSTCGLVFNEARDGQCAFGPDHWEGNALVAGFSRGRIWRVQLVKTPHGYVGRQIPLAVSSMLLADLAVSPQGDLYVTCHSGTPDWGTGPQGEGRLYRLRFAGDEEPQVVLTYPTGPLEIKVAFDRPVTADIVDRFKDQAIRYGRHVRAGDRLEVHKPPYATVEQQADSHRGVVPISGARLSEDRRTLTLTTAPHPLPGMHALTLPTAHTGAERATSSIHEVDYDLSGLQAQWIPQGSDRPTWGGWLPHVQPDVIRALCQDSSEHEVLVSLLQQPGTLRLSGFVELPETATTLQLISSTPARLRYGDRAELVSAPHAGVQLVEVVLDGQIGRQSLEIIIAGGSGIPDLELTYRRAGDDAQRVVELNRLHVPWSPPEIVTEKTPATDSHAQIAGDQKRGEAIFFGRSARCADCHSIHGRGAKLAPELDEVSQRSVDSILRDIRDPSATIHPDYLNYTMTLNDGRVLTGTVRTDTEGTLVVTDHEARQSSIDASDIEQFMPLSTSMMPTGLLDTLSESEVDDLLAFLLAPPPVAKEEPNFPQRTAAEIQSALSALAADRQQQSAAPLTITLLAGKKDHGPGEHDYPAWQISWAKLLEGAEGITLQRAMEWPTREQWEASDVVVFYLWNHHWSPERMEELDTFLARGGGAVVLHAATISDDDPEALAQRWGLAAQPKRTKYRHGPVTLSFASDNKQPLVAGFSKLSLIDETYWPMVGDRQNVNVLATAVEEDAEWPMIWTFQPGRGRVWASIIGHYSATLEDPLYRILVLRGIAWAGGQPIHRLQAHAVQ